MYSGTTLKIYQENKSQTFQIKSANVTCDIKKKKQNQKKTKKGKNHNTVKFSQHSDN
jgi:uncharacterized protein (UPF0335 family)